jgi:MFS family permease
VIGSVTYAIIARGYPESVRPRMLALTSTAWVVPGLIGPAIAGVIGDYVGWRWVFLGLVPIPLLAVVLSRQSLHGLTRTSDQPRDWSQVLRSVRLALGVTLLTIGLGTALPWGLLIVAASLVLAIPALQKLLPTGTLRAAAGLPAAVACMGLLSLCFFGVDVFIPLALTSVRGLPAVIAGLALTSATVTWTAGSWMLDRLVDRYSRRMFGAVGMVLIIIGIGLSLLMLNPLVPALLGVLAWGVAGLGIGLTYTTLSLATLDLAPKGQEGLSAASLQVNDTLGSAIGTGLGGVIIASYGAAGKVAALETQFVLMLAVAVLGLVVALRLPGQRKSTD